MKSQQQGFTINQQKSISLISSYLFFELLSFKKFQQTSFLIPDIILLDKGMIKQWLFNSIKQQNKILKKRKQNNTSLNVVKSFCLKSGYNFSHINTFTQLIAEYSSIKKQQSRKQPIVLKTLQDKKVIEIITLDDEILSVSLTEFLNLVNQNNFNQSSFYDKWKIIRQKINNESKIQQYYEVISSRKNHVIQSKCHKIISVKTQEISPNSITSFNQMKQQTQDNQNKNLQGYKFFDTFLNKKFFKIVQQLIEFIEKNYKCIVEEIRTKYVINKNREPHFVGIYSLKIKPAKKLISQDEFERFSQKGCIKVEDYIKLLINYLYEIQTENNIHTALTLNIVKKSKCRGEFCKVNVKKHSLFNDPSQTKISHLNHFNLDPAVVPAYKKLVPNDFVNEVHKKKQKIMQKLKQYNIIEFNPDEWTLNQSDYEQSDEQQIKNVKVCENCYLIYSHIQKFYEIDFRSGNLIEKKQSILNDQTLRIRSQSQKRFLPILKKFQFENQNDEKMSLGTISMINKDETPRKEGKNDFKQIQTNEKLKSISPRARSHTKLQSSNQKTTVKKLSDLKKVKLDPLQRFIQNGPSKGNRLLELAKSTQGAQQFLQSVKFKKQKSTINQGKITKANNFQQAESNLLSQFRKLHCSSQEQLIYFAMKYARDNIPQQIDRQCFSSQYLSFLYQFMINSDLNLHPKNRIKKRPEISLKRLSELTDYPEIVSKSAFHFDTIITDQKTTIPFCVITTKMINGKNAVNIPYQNVFICQDIFDSFIEHFFMVKDILQNAVNKRIVLFNYPGQSHTIYNNELPFNFIQFSFILDKLFFKLSTEKGQLGFVNFKKDKFKFVGIGFGGYLLSTYLDSNCDIFGKQNLTGILFVNAYKKIIGNLKEKSQKLRILYQHDDKMTISEAHLFYNKTIHSSETDKEDLQYKSGLNPIRNSGRVYLLKSLLDMSTFENNQHNSMIQNLQNINFCPVHIIYGSKNIFFPKSQAQSLLKLKETNNDKTQNHNLKLVQIKGGHDLMADNYQDLQKYIEQFINL